MALSFQVRVGIPGCLTIEIDAASAVIPTNQTNLYAPLNQGLLMSDPGSLVSKVWGQGWATPMTQRLIALGGNLKRQLLSLECPSIDVTDMAWGGNASIDATTDPAQINVTPFGTSNFGRAFAVGDYIIWDDPTVINGRYQYEIDQIQSLAPFVLQRRGPNAPLGSAQFGSYKGAHANCNFLQLLDPSFQVLWDGTHQIYKFLWDNTIVAAVSATLEGS